MNIVFIYDDNYKQFAKITEKSVLKHNPGAKIYQINKLPLKYQKIFKGYENALHPTNICYAKLFIHEILPDLDKVLYLDTDLICLDSLEELYNTDFDNKLIVGCESHDFGKKQAQELGNDKYFNSGVMLLNLKELRNRDVSENIKKNFEKLVDKTLWVYDETIINGLLYDDIKFISHKWNYCINRQYKNREITDPKIIHFIGSDKSGMLNYEN